MRGCHSANRSIWKRLRFKGNNRLRCARSGVGYKAEKTNTREERTVLRESLQLSQVISSTSEPHSANPMWSLWIPQEPPLLQPEDLSISVSSDVGGRRFLRFLHIACTVWETASHQERLGGARGRWGPRGGSGDGD